MLRKARQQQQQHNRKAKQHNTTRLKHVYMRISKNYNFLCFMYHMYIYVKVTCKGVRMRGFLSRLLGLCPLELEGLLVPFSSGILSPSYTHIKRHVHIYVRSIHVCSVHHVYVQVHVLEYMCTNYTCRYACM